MNFWSELPRLRLDVLERPEYAIDGIDISAAVVVTKKIVDGFEQHFAVLLVRHGWNWFHETFWIWEDNPHCYTTKEKEGHGTYTHMGLSSCLNVFHELFNDVAIQNWAYIF